MSFKADGTIIAPVNTDDVNFAIDAGSHDIGTLCMSDKQNMWSKFKAMQHDTPLPYTNAERRAKQWGLDVPVYRVIQTPTEMPPQWKHVRPNASSFKVLNDFVGDGDDEGYNHNAPPLVETSVTYKNKNTVTIHFAFNQYADNGGICLSDMPIYNFIDGTMQSLYPGAVIFKWEDGWKPKQIATTNETIGTKPSTDVEVMTNYLGTGEFAILPVFTKDAYIPAQSVSTASMQFVTVLYAHNSWLVRDISDANVGLWLFTRRDIGINDFSGNNVGTGYFKFSGTANWSDVERNPGDPDTRHDYYWWFRPNDSGPMVLRPQTEYETLSKSDNRIAITLTFKPDYAGNYGLGDWNPITNGDDYSSLEDYKSLYRDYDYGIASWLGGIDNEGYTLVLRWKAFSGKYDGNGGWSVTFLRVLALVDERGETCWESSGSKDSWYAQTIERNAGNGRISVKGQGIRKIRVSNSIVSQGASNYANGVIVRMYGADGDYATWSAGQGIGYINASEYSLSFNTRDVDKSIQRIPTSTYMYIDITVDTMDSVEDIE